MAGLVCPDVPMELGWESAAADLGLESVWAMVKGRGCLGLVIGSAVVVETAMGLLAAAGVRSLERPLTDFAWLTLAEAMLPLGRRRLSCDGASSVRPI